MLGFGPSPAVTITFRDQCGVSMERPPLPQELVVRSPLLPSVIQQTKAFCEANICIEN